MYEAEISLGLFFWMQVRTFLTFASVAKLVIPGKMDRSGKVVRIVLPWQPSASTSRLMALGGRYK